VPYTAKRSFNGSESFRSEIIQPQVHNNRETRGLFLAATLHDIYICVYVLVAIIDWVRVVAADYPHTHIHRECV